jgi:hypothetical protein
MFPMGINRGRRGRRIRALLCPPRNEIVTVLEEWTARHMYGGAGEAGPFPMHPLGGGRTRDGGQINGLTLCNCPQCQKTFNEWIGKGGANNAAG